MRFARRLVLLPLLSLLAACSPTTPLFVAQVTTLSLIHISEPTRP